MNQEDFNRLYEWAEKTKAEFAIGYNLEGVQKIEEVILKTRSSFGNLPEKEQFGRINAFGAFLGQCMIANFNGKWCRNGDAIGIKLDGQGIWADPFQKVWKQFQKEGGQHSILSFYRTSRNFAMDQE